jgi:tetratricopeptide (TPR) repeat protein
MHAAPGQFEPLCRRDWLAAAVIASIAAVVFSPTLGCEFLNLDDTGYVTDNPHVTSGLTADSVRWAFTTADMGNWHPMTWLSLQLDAHLWGLDPRGFHLTNVFLHATNGALVFLALRSLTGAFWRSAAVALLFAVHPLRTEAVAWVSERKGVLSAWFGLIALWAYARYARSPGAGRYLLVVVGLALSLMAKPMLVTFPFLALLLDWWPLGRARTAADWRRLAVEKLPLLLLVLAFSVVAYRTQSASGALGLMDVHPLSVRLKNAVVSYTVYLALSVYPVGLAHFHPHPGPSLALWKIAGALLLLAVVTVSASGLRRRAPYLLAGWLWYLGTLVPMIGLVPVGGIAYADRHTYFPQIGVLLAVSWGVADLAAGRHVVALAAGVAAAVALAVGSYYQEQYWRNSLALWQRDIDVVEPWSIGLNVVGELLSAAGRDDEAAARFRAALKVDGTFYQAHANLADIAFRKGNLDEAAREFDQACRLKPGLSTAFSGYGRVELFRNRIDHALALFQQALVLEPESAVAHEGMGQTLLAVGKRDQALAHLRQAVRCDPGYGFGHASLGKALEDGGDLGGAAEQFEEATHVQPKEALFWVDLGRVRRRQGRAEEAARCLQRAAELDPSMDPAGTPVRATP